MMKHKLKVTLLTLLLIALAIVIPIWIGPDMGPGIHTVLGLVLEWFFGLVAIAFIAICLGIIGMCFLNIYELVEEFLDR